jgi:hypothetical protein
MMTGRKDLSRERVKSHAAGRGVFDGAAPGACLEALDESILRAGREAPTKQVPSIDRSSERASDRLNSNRKPGRIDRSIA